MKLIKQYWPDLLLIALLTLLPALFFWRLLTPNPADRMDIAHGDFTEQYFPLRAFTAQQWVQGHIPLWNPYLYGGQPALADIQSGALYPPHVIEALLLGWGGPQLLGREIGFPLWALEWQVIFHFSLVAVGTYLFFRSVHDKTCRTGILPVMCEQARCLSYEPKFTLRQTRFGAVIASLVFTYSGYLTGFPVQQITILEVSAWLPWLLLGVAMPSSVLGGIALAMALLAGHPQTVMVVIYLTLAYTLWSSPQSKIQNPKSKMVMVLIAFGLSAAQLFPTLEFIAHSVRANLSYEAVSAGLPLTELVSILYPGFFGGSPEYVGLVSLPLVVLALMFAPKRIVLFWSGAVLVSLLLAFGGNTFLYPLFYLIAPGFGMVRQQERIFLIYSFGLAILSGYGAMVLTSPLPKPIRPRYALFERYFYRIVAIAFALTAFFIYGSTAATARGDKVNLFYGVLHHHLFGLLILAGMAVLLKFRTRRWLRRTWGMSLLASWVAFNLFTVNWQFNLEKPSDKTEPFFANGVVNFLQQHCPTGTSVGRQQERIVSGGLLPGGNSAASVYELADLTGNTPLQLATVDNFFKKMDSWRMWQLMNVRYVVAHRDLASAGLLPVFAEGDIRVFEITDPFPKAWLVSQVEVIADDNAAIARLSADSFDLRRQAILAEPLNSKESLGFEENPLKSVTVTEITPTHLKAEIVVSNQQLVIFSQIYYPGWQATLNGQPTDLHRVNVILSGVVVPPGAHTIELTFWPFGKLF